MSEIRDRFLLDECVDWIRSNNHTRVLLQFKKNDMKYSLPIVQGLKQIYGGQPDSDKSKLDLDLYVVQSNTCCVDLLASQHISNLDAIIHFGKVCLSKPMVKNQQQSDVPILFVFDLESCRKKEEFIPNVDRIVHELEIIKSTEPHCRICLLYDNDLLDYVNEVKRHVDSKGLNDFVELAKLHFPSTNWSTTIVNQSNFVRDGKNLFGHFALQDPIDKYTCALYLGTGLSIQLILSGPSKLFKFDCRGMIKVEKMNVSKVLNKRIALVGQLKDLDELKIGVIITNPLPDLNVVMKRLKSCADSRKHMLYFISMIQTIDECKIGNFDLCDAFVVINSCTCSTILESLVFNRPIMTELEFKLSCGFEAEYGRVVWPGSSSHLSEDDMINKRKVSDVTLALVQTRKELLERCSQARVNKWSGMDYKATCGDDGGDPEESLNIEDGLKGIASSYKSEPLKRTNLDKQCYHSSNERITGDNKKDDNDAGCGGSGIARK